MDYSANIINFFKRNLKKSFLMLRGVVYYGNKFECPVCTHHFRKMIPGGFDVEVISELDIIGAGYRLNNVCPYCLSTDRDRLVYYYLTQLAHIFDTKQRLLHMGPEPALLRVFKKSSNLDYTYAAKYAEGTYYPADIAFFDLQEIPFEAGTFDVVICNHVLEHIENDHLAMSEIFRVLKPGGYAILQVPISYKIKNTFEDPSITDPAERHRTFGQFDHVRIYGPDYPDRLAAVGFKVNMFTPFDEKDDFKMINRYAINHREKLFVAHKPENE